MRSDRSVKHTHNMLSMGQDMRECYWIGTTAGITTYHLIKQFEKKKDGNADWAVLCEWFGGDVIQAETTDSMRGKLIGYCLHNSNLASQHINNFLTLCQELNKIPGEGLLENHALSIFLCGVKDTDYETFVEIQRNNNESLQHTIIVLRKKERVILANRKARRILRNRVRRILRNRARRILRNRARRIREEYEEEDKEEEKCQTKIRRVKGKHNYDHVDRIQMVKKGYLCIPDNVWLKELSKDEKDFVISFKMHSMITARVWHVFELTNHTQVILGYGSKNKGRK
eukprot:672459-Ditylum_brightwellii.AAC.1